MEKTPQEHADFSTLRCWFFSITGKEVAVERLLKGLNIKTHDVPVPKTFSEKLRMAVLGPRAYLPKEDFPDVVITTTKKASSQVNFIKQQSPNTYIISIMYGHQPYANLCLRRDEILCQSSIGLVRGKLLRHLCKN